MNPTVTIEGRLGQDPELRFTPSGDAVCNFSVVTSDNKKDAQGDWQELRTSWWNCSIWRSQAENVAESLRKGDLVLVLGRLSEREWEDREGNKRRSMDLEAFAIGPSLKFNAVEVKRTQRSKDSRGNAGDDPWAAGSGRATSENKPADDVDPPF